MRVVVEVIDGRVRIIVENAEIENIERRASAETVSEETKEPAPLSDESFIEPIVVSKPSEEETGASGQTETTEAASVEESGESEKEDTWKPEEEASEDREEPAKPGSSETELDQEIKKIVEKIFGEK